jgi:hypothetical protein
MGHSSLSILSSGLGQRQAGIVGISDLDTTEAVLLISSAFLALLATSLLTRLLSQSKAILKTAGGKVWVPLSNQCPAYRANKRHKQKGTYRALTCH